MTIQNAVIPRPIERPYYSLRSQIPKRQVIFWGRFKVSELSTKLEIHLLQFLWRNSALWQEREAREQALPALSGVCQPSPSLTASTHPDPGLVCEERSRRTAKPHGWLPYFWRQWQGLGLLLVYCSTVKTLADVLNILTETSFLICPFTWMCIHRHL